MFALTSVATGLDWSFAAFIMARFLGGLALGAPSGINTIIDYAPAIFKSAEWKMDAALFSMFIVELSNLAFTVVSF